MTKYALVIGIPEYNNFDPLEKTTQDAEKIAQILHFQGDYQVTRVPCQGNADSKDYRMKEGKVTYEDLKNNIKLFLEEIAKNQPALIYFTGHGFTVHDDLLSDQGFLATSDCKVDFEGNKIVKQNNGFPLAGLNNLIEKANLSELVVLLDCCHSGNYLETQLMRNQLNTFDHKQNYYLLTASRAYETAKTIRKDQHSVFSGALIEGLSEQNANPQGKISCDRLSAYINDKIAGKLQTPLRMGIGTQIVLVKYPPKTSEVSQEIEPVKDKQGDILCPYQGLDVFTAKQQEFFFGRKKLIEDIKQKLEQEPIIPLIGASGSGKSSVIYAGIIPWLEKEDRDWEILTTIKPGIEPLSELRRVFRDQVSLEEEELQEIIENTEQENGGMKAIFDSLPSHSSYFLFIDQFEEVFTVCRHEAERKRFIDLVTEVVSDKNSPLKIILTMRVDFLDRFLQYESLYQIIQRQAIYIPPLEGINLRDIIVEPALRQGFTVENSLLAELLKDVGKEQGFLPLLEFALTLLWQKKDVENKKLTLKAYQQLGKEEQVSKSAEKSSTTGLNRALNLYAEKVYKYRDYRDQPKKEREKIEKELIKLIFLRLIRTSGQGKETRQRQEKKTLINIAEQDQKQQKIIKGLIDGKQGLVASRLLVADKEKKDQQNHEVIIIDLAHEALIEGWQRFRLWQEENRDQRILAERLETQRQEWLNNRIEDNLMMGGLLMRVREQWQQLSPFLKYPAEAEKFYHQSDNTEKAKIRELS